jgi:hypothetical protein
MDHLRNATLLCSIALLFGACGESPADPQTNTGGPNGGDGQFTLEVRYIGTPTEAQRSAVEHAAERWRSAIRSELQDIPVIIPAADCFDTQPELDETIDDVVVYVQFVPIDGVGEILGQAGPCYIRTVGGLPLLGFIQLDVADADKIDELGRLDDLILHEITHVLGFGTVWEDASLLFGAGSTDPLFSGSLAVAAFQLLNPLAIAVPVENLGESGTRDSHWRESIFRNELMTGYLTTSSNPLSAVSIQSMADLGYLTDASIADSFELGGGITGARIDIHAGEQVMLPRYRVDQTGFVQRLIR